MVYEFSGEAGPVTISLRPGSITVGLEGRANYTFDGEGRLVGAFLYPTAERPGCNYRRTFDNRLIQKWREVVRGRSKRRRRLLSPRERDAFLRQTQEAILLLLQALQSGAVRPTMETPVRDVLAALNQAAHYGPAGLETDAHRFRSIYKPIGILPPDQYLALVLQATEGCSWNRCTFCTFYRDRRFYVKTVDKFRDHIAAVRAYLGAGLPMRRGIFLADANALVIPQKRLLPLFDLVLEAFELAPVGIGDAELARWRAAHPEGLDGIYSFISAFDTLHKSVSEFAALAERGLRRAYIGLESGSDELLQFLQKPGTAADAVRAVHRLKAAGVAVGVIIMVGVGGDLHAERHLRDTIAVVNEMGLDAGDLIYFSEFQEMPGAPYVPLARAAGIRPLTEEEMAAQQAAMRTGFRFGSGGAPRMVTYALEEFAY
ncbi:MAG TPA: radical SAM protein [Anaerolineae bacterium]|nr:radical SAM protein [Anaerolineae bacterium]